MNNLTSGIQRTLKILTGLALLIFFFFGEGDIRYLGIAGLMPLISGITGSCSGTYGCKL